jgi:tocopherol O-methyltransferase
VATTARYRRLLLSPATRNRSFALSLPRLILAYRQGAMRYGIFTFEKPR